MRLRLKLLVLAVAGIASPVLAQDAAPDCANFDNLNQQEMNECSYQDYQAADKKLNAVYKKVKALMTSWDADQDPSDQGAVKALQDGQRGWITYRDGYCTAYGFQAHGGTLEGQLVDGCMAGLTKVRTKELKQLLDDVSSR